MRTPDSTEKCKNLCDSTVTAACGFVNAVRYEKKVRHVFLTMILVTAIAFAVDVGYFQIAIIIFSWVMTLICELFNTALEKALDYTSHSEIHPLIRQGKDYASASTFIAILFASCLTLFLIAGRYFSLSNVV